MPQVKRLGGCAGVTLTELVVAMVILSIGVLGLVSTMGGIQRSLQLSKSKTLGANLCQEQMQILKQKNYYQVLVTTNPTTHPDFTDLRYDEAYFPPESILEGGVTYTRYSLVEVAREDSGAIVTLPPSTPDTGMRLLTVSAVWRQANEVKRSTVRSILTNPDTVMATSIISGTVSPSTGGVIPGAVVNISENQGWRDTANISGVYSINLSPGSFNMLASAQGYFPELRSVSAAANASQTQNFSLVAMSSGSVTGTAWLRGHPDSPGNGLVISHVVVSTVQADTGMDVQFVELYNPTTGVVTVGGASPPIKLNFQSGCSGAGNVACANTTYGIKLDYTVSSVPAGGYYLVANTTTFTVNGRLMTADAVYADAANTFCGVAPAAGNWSASAIPPIKKIAVAAHNGNFWISDASNRILDAVGWLHGGNPVPPHCETACIDIAAGGPAGEQFVRITSPTYTAADLSVYGRAYDSDANRVDITTTTGGIVYNAYSTADSTQTTASGRVAAGAIVTATDGLSSSTQAVAVSGVARFGLPQVATGTWTVFVTSGNFLLQHDTVTITATGSVFPFPSSMTYLDSANSDGFISGRVLNVAGAPISPAIVVNTGSSAQQTTANSSTGRYLLRAAPGVLDIFANPSPGNASYVSQTSAAVTVVAGSVANGVDFTLSEGGRSTGFVTRDGVNALPGVVVTAVDTNGYSRDTQVTDSSGRFTLVNLTTGQYSIEPAVGSHETASPSAQSVVITAGGTVFSATFTVSGALGAIRGAVTLGGSPLRTGVLVMATTGTISGAPPAFSTASLSMAAYYMTSSREDGSYHLDVRGSTNPAYNVYAWYTTITSTGGAAIQPRTRTGVQVTAGGSTTGQDFTW